MKFEGKIKGIHIINVLNYVKYKRGLLGLNVFINKLNEGKQQPDQQDENYYVEKDWYLYETYLQFIKLADDVVGNGDLTKCYDIGYYSVHNLGHLSYLTRAGDIFEFGKYITDHWNQVYDFGKPDWKKVNDKEMVFSYHGFPKDKAKCEYFRGSLAGMLELCSLKGKVEEVKCNTENDDYCEYVLTWE